MSASRSRIVLIAVALVAAGLIAALMSSSAGATTAASASAQAGVSARAINYYGSIALSTDDGAVGWSYDYRTKRKAINRAKRECRNESSSPWSCKKVGWVRNGCLALAVRWSGDSVARWASAYAYSKRAAYRAAKNKCGSGCRKRAYTCTTR